MPIVYSTSSSGQPPQALPVKDKNEKWKRANLDWAEQFLRSELPLKARRIIKNYNVAMGVIDIEDYIDVELNDYSKIYDTVESQIQESLLQDDEISIDDLFFFPIVPAIINILVGEMMKKFDHIKIKAIDEYSTNEYWEYKKKLVLDYLKQKAEKEIQAKLGDSGLDPQSQEYQQQAQQMEQEAMNLPQIQKFMNRNYKNNYEEWANRILEQAKLKYKLDEKEPESFKHQLITDEAYWHIRFDDNDLDVELWNPIEVISLKSKDRKYTSDADFVGRQYYATIADVISKFKNKIDHRLIERNNNPLGLTTNLTDWKHNAPGDNESNMLPERKLLAFKYMIGGMEFTATSKVLVTEIYWVSQRRLGHLRAVYEDQPVEKIVDDMFKVTIKPQYNEEGTLIAGEEVEYFYAPQVWKGVKLNFSNAGSNINFDTNSYLDDTISGRIKNKDGSIDDDVEKGVFYIDVQPTEYQFSDVVNPFRPKIPVVGCTGFEPTMNLGVPYSLVDKTKGYQILFNSAMNEINNFMKTEIGLFYTPDQKTIPRNSMDGSWGKYNFQKWILTAKENQVAPMDSSSANTEGQVFQQPTVVNLLRTDQFKSRLELAQAFKMGLFETIGITPQRMGTVNSQETATGVTQAVNNSYAQTEYLSFQHTQLMREFKTLLLDAEKYMESKKPVSRVQYMNSEEENIMFEIDTDSLPLRRYNIWLTSNADTQRVLEQLRQLAIQNNTSGATILDLATIIESSNTREIKDTLQQSIINTQQQEQAKMKHQQDLQQQQIQAAKQLQDEKLAFDAEQREKDRIKDMYVADVRALGFAKNTDMNSNQVPDALEVEKFNLDQNKNYADIVDKQYAREAKTKEIQGKLDIEKEKLIEKQQDRASKEKVEKLKADIAKQNMKNDLQIAKENAKGRNKP